MLPPSDLHIYDEFVLETLGAAGAVVGLVKATQWAKKLMGLDSINELKYQKGAARRIREFALRIVEKFQKVLLPSGRVSVRVRPEFQAWLKKTDGLFLYLKAIYPRLSKDNAIVRRLFELKRRVVESSSDVDFKLAFRDYSNEFVNIASDQRLVAQFLAAAKPDIEAAGRERRISIGDYDENHSEEKKKMRKFHEYLEGVAAKALTNEYIIEKAGGDMQLFDMALDDEIIGRLADLIRSGKKMKMKIFGGKNSAEKAADWVTSMEKKGFEEFHVEENYDQSFAIVTSR